MCKEYIEQLNQLIGIAPHLAYAEIKTSRRDTLIDEIESSIRLSGLPDCRARDISIRVIKGDLTALRLPPYVPGSHSPQRPSRQSITVGSGTTAPGARCCGRKTGASAAGARGGRWRKS